MIDKLEKKIGKYAVKNLIFYILGAYVVGYVLYLAKPEWYQYITLSPALVARGQIWRLFTWVCTVPQSLSILLIFMFLFYFYIGRALEKYMGAFKYNLYVFSGWLFTTAGAMIVYGISYAVAGPFGAISINASTYYINLTSFLAFALLFPDAKVYLFGLLPIRMKILAWIDAGLLSLQVISGLIIAVVPDTLISDAMQLYTGTPVSSSDMEYLRRDGIEQMITILISVLNFLVFFFIVIRKNARNKKRANEFARRAEQGRQTAGSRSTGAGPGWAGGSSYSRGQDPNAGTAASDSSDRTASQETGTGKSRYRSDSSQTLLHTCSICGRTNITNPELMFRFCSKCCGNHEYCQDHLFTHEHVKQ